VTSLPVTADNVVEVAACARARWKIENQSSNVLKNHGYHLEHNFGHGKQNLAQLFVLLNLLAFAFHTVCDSVEKLWQEARAILGTRKRFFSDLHTITAYLLFPDWHALCSAMVQGNAPTTQTTQSLLIGFRQLELLASTRSTSPSTARTTTTFT
jgi:hypothetical protein